MNTKNSDISAAIFLLICMIISCNLGWQYLILPNIILSFLIINKRNFITFNHSIIPLVCMLIFGTISICTASGDKQDAIHEFGVILSFVLAFTAGRATNTKTTVRAVSTIGVIIAAVGILSYCSIIRTDEFIFNDRGLVRLQSFIKYANTTAVLLGCSYYAMLDELQRTDKICLRYLASCILLAMFLTFSKAEIPLFILIGTLLCLVTKKHIRLFVIQSSICAVFAAVMLILVKQNRNSIALMLALLCIVIAGKINFKIIKNDRIFVYIWILMTALGLIGGIMLSVRYKFDIFTTLFKRLDYTYDALKLLKDNWFTGIGSGAWRFRQYQIQSTEYSVTYLHNGWLQFWLENGIVFFAAFISLFACGLLNTIKHKQYSILAILLLIMLHSLADINFCFGIILIVSGLLLGNVTEGAVKIRPTPTVCCIIAGISIVFNIYTGYEFILRKDFEKAYINEQYEDAYRYAKKLEHICPYDSTLKVSLAAIDNSGAKDNLETAIGLSPYNKDIFKNYISYLISSGYTDAEYTELFDKYITLAPKQEKTYLDVKKLSKSGYEKNLYGLREYDEIISNAEKRRKEENVTDRNELLNELTSEKGQ